MSKANGFHGLAGVIPADFGNAFAAEEEEPTCSRTPEQRLLLYTLSRAYADIFGGEHQSRSEYFKPNPAARRDAIAWILSEEQELFSFRWVCEQLGINDIRIRALRRLVSRVSAHGSA